MKFFISKERSLFIFYLQSTCFVNLLTSIRLKFSHLSKLNFSHNFKNTEVLLRSYGKDNETAEHFFLGCPFFVNERQQLLNNLFDRHLSLQKLNEKSVTDSNKFTDLISLMNMKTKISN